MTSESAGGFTAGRIVAFVLVALGLIFGVILLGVNSLMDRLSRDALEAARPAQLRDLRQSFATDIHREADTEQPPTPPEDLFELTRYPAPLGDNLAFVTPAHGGEPGPAIVWIIGGFWWGLGDTPWRDAGRDDDQSARAFRDAGLAMMFPSLRGTMGNAGRPECFFGEVDDIIAAGRHLKERADVDPNRVYVGGHSTGGTLALLVAESTDLFAGAIALGPIDDPRGYGAGCPPESVEGLEARIRAPIEWVEQIRIPTLIVEGAEGNAPSLHGFEKWKGGAPVTTLEIPAQTHFTVIAPATEAIAARLARGEPPTAVGRSDILGRLAPGGGPSLPE